MMFWRGSLLLLGAFSVTARAQGVLHEISGSTAYDFLGIAVAGAGDVDGDGRADLIAGALGYNAVGARAIVWSGGTGVALHTLPVAQIGAVAGLGDLDGDGRSEVAVGDIGDATFGVNTGRVAVHSGATGAILFSLTGTAARDYFGAAVDCAGDVNGDGVPDIIVGATQPSTSSPGAGYARVHSGANGALLHAFAGAAIGDLFGTTVTGLGDANGDHRDDVAVGAPGEDTPVADAGRVRVYSGLTGQVLFTFSGFSANDGLGRALDGIGDLNSDGAADILIGNSGDNTTGAASGVVRVHSGSNGSVLRTIYGNGPGDRFGAQVAGCGDVDGDAFLDLAAAGSLGGHSVRVHTGTGGGLMFRVDGPNLGAALAGPGDVDGNGLQDVLASDPITSSPTEPEVGTVYVLSLIPPSTGTKYCFGDGSGTPCPCANSGAAGHGCENSVSTGGGLLQASGLASVSADSITLHATGMTPVTSSLFFQGTSVEGGGLGVAFGDGLRCASGTVTRLGVRTAVNGFASLGALVAGSPLISVAGQIPAVGGVRRYQCWYRNNAAFCQPAAFNLTNAVELAWSP